MVLSPQALHAGMRNKLNVHSLDGSSIKQMVCETLGEVLGEKNCKIITNYHPIINITVYISTFQLSVEDGNTFLIFNS